MFHKIKDVKTMPDYKLQVHFVEGQTKEYSIKDLAETIPAFNQLMEDSSLFESVSVDVGGYGIIWNDDLDLSCDELWDNGKRPKAS